MAKNRGICPVRMPTLGWLIKTIAASPAPHISAAHQLSISIDTRTLQTGQVFWALKGTRDGHDFAAVALTKGATAAVVSQEWKNSADPVLRDRLIGVDDTYGALRQAAVSWRNALSCPVVGITGTNGKTSTKDLVHRLLSMQFSTGATSGNYNNEIGVPLTLLSIPQDAQMAVIEMGASHRNDIRFLCEIARPTHGLVTSIGKAHLAGFGSLEVIAETKGELYEAVSDYGTAFVPFDDRLCVEKSASCRRRIGYGFGEPGNRMYESVYCATKLTFDGRGCSHFVFDGTEIKLGTPGRAAALSALSALTVAKTFGISATTCRDSVSEWRGVSGRNSILPLDDLLIMDDSYNANPGSMRAALETLSMLSAKRRVAILGDMNELGSAAEFEHRELAMLLPAFGVELAVFIGLFAGIAAQAARDVGVKSYEAASCDEITESLAGILRKGDAVLVKGSRGVHLEQVVDQIKKVFG